MKLAQLLLLLLAAVLLTVAGVLFAFNLSHKLPSATQQVPYLFYVSNDVGVDAGTDIFRLGAITPGGGAERTIYLNGTVVGNATPVVTVLVRGDGAEWLSVVPPSVTLPGAVNISVAVPSNAPLGTYRGEILVIPGNYTQ